MFLRILSMVAFCALLAAEDWPQWRGPNRDGVVAGFTGPQAWPEKLTLKWKVEVGEGHSSPVVAGGKVYLHTRQGEREVVTCLAPDSGKVLWRESYDAPYTMNPAATRHGKGVKSTPVVSGGRVCTLGISGTLSCFDAQTGKPAWRKQSGPATFGTAMSPVVERGLLIAHMGPQEGGALTAFDLQTGAEKWSWKGDGPAYTSPVVLDLAGARQVVTQSRGQTIGVNAATGELLWQLPYTTPYEQNIVTPVLYKDLLILSGLNNGVMAVKVVRRGAAYSAETVWQNKDVSMYMSSPVLKGDLLFGLSHRNRGQFFCLNAATGATLWTSEGRQGDNAAIVLAGSSLLLLTTESELIVANAGGKAFEAVRKYPVASSPVWAHPAVVGRGILVKDEKTLALWELP
jgi:outer membrane protein assembly factor BamB